MKREDEKTLLDKTGVKSILNKINDLNDELNKLQSKRREDFKNTDSDGWNTPKFTAVDVARIKYDIEKLKTKLANAVIVNELNSNINIVSIGDVLELSLDYGDDIESMIIRLGTVHQKKTEDGIEIISIESSLGKAIYKKEVGTTVKFGDENSFSATILRKINENVKDETIDKPKQFSKK